MTLQCNTYYRGIQKLYREGMGKSSQKGGVVSKKYQKKVT